MSWKSKFFYQELSGLAWLLRTHLQTVPCLAAVRQHLQLQLHAWPVGNGIVCVIKPCQNFSGATTNQDTRHFWKKWVRIFFLHHNCNFWHWVRQVVYFQNHWEKMLTCLKPDLNYMCCGVSLVNFLPKFTWIRSLTFSVDSKQNILKTFQQTEFWSINNIYILYYKCNISQEVQNLLSFPDN